MKSSWAYNNGKRQAKDAEIKEAPLFGWVRTGDIDRDALFSYAERNKHDTSKLVVKTYANKKQAIKKMNDIRSSGIECWVRLNCYPFIIQAINMQ